MATDTNTLNIEDIDFDNLGEVLTDDQINALLALDSGRGSFKPRLTMAVNNGQQITNLTKLFPDYDKASALKSYAKLRMVEDHPEVNAQVIKVGNKENANEMVLLVNLDNRVDPTEIS